jgi:hypothetical protein
MKKSILLLVFLFVANFSFAQSNSFDNDMDVISFMEGKTFYNSDNGLQIQYGYSSRYNTNCIMIENDKGDKFYHVNVSIETYGTYADLYGMNPDNGSNFGFRLFKTKLIVGYGEQGAVTFYLK